MEMITVTAKTLDEAITKALIQLGTTSDNLEYTVIEREAQVFWGLLVKKMLSFRQRRKRKMIWMTFSPWMRRKSNR